MKKIFVIALVAGTVVTNAYAHLIQIDGNKMHPQNYVKGWNLYRAEDSIEVKYADPKMQGHVVFFMNEDVLKDGHNQNADTVTFTCSGVKTHLLKATWMDCEIKPGASVEVTINPEDFHNGAEGIFEIVK